MGLSIEQAKAHLCASFDERPIGLSWDKIAEMQRSGPLKRLNVQKQRAKGRPCARCGKPSGSVGLMPLCKKCGHPEANL